MKDEVRKFAGNPADPDYRKLVGHGWGTYAAHQFNVLTSLGLKKDHELLDIGCGGLRGGRLFIAFLEKGNYCGIEPSDWAIQEAIDNEFGEEYIKIRMPSFSNTPDADLSTFNRKFDFILAHSVIVHAPKSWVDKCFQEVKKVLKPDGKFVANIILGEDSGEDGWDYPEARYHSMETVVDLAHKAGLSLNITEIDHPAEENYTWVVFTHEDNN